MMFVYEAGEVRGLSHWSGWLVNTAELPYQQKVKTTCSIVLLPTCSAVHCSFH